MKKLDDNVAQKLRSQVFIPNFASAISELIQNSIDANATEILCKIKLDDLSFIVLDNGMGVPHNDLKVTALPSYTSKCVCLHDLDDLNTFGFRGQALSSIASTSMMTVISRTPAAPTASKIRIHYSKRLYEEPLLVNDSLDSRFSTSVQVDRLFSNVPVRSRLHRRRSKATECEAIRSALADLSFSAPNFFLSAKLVDDFSSNSFVNSASEEADVFTVDTRLATELSNKNKLLAINSALTQQALPPSEWSTLNFSCARFAVEGIISASNANARRTSNFVQRIFINKLKLNASHVYKKINSLDKSVKLCYVFLVRGPLSAQDVIQDPNKEIHQSSLIPDVQRELVSMVSAWLDSKKTLISRNSVSSRSDTGLDRSETLIEDPPLNVAVREHILPSLSTRAAGFQSNLNESSYFSTKNKSKLTRSNLKLCKVISQVDSKFILVRSDNLLIMFDQHAVDERIRIEANISALFNQSITSTSIEPSLLFKSTKREFAIISDYSHLIEQWGISMSLDENTEEITVTALPDILLPQHSDSYFVKKLIVNHAYDLYEGKASRIEINNVHGSQLDWTLKLTTVPQEILKLMTSNACRYAIMFGENLSKEKCQSLLDQLSNCKYPFQCAHGRPSAVPIADFTSP